MRDGVLIQEEYLDAPVTVRGAWRVVVSSLMCKMTAGRAVRPVLDEIFKRWPNPEALARAGEDLEQLLRPTGFMHRRAEELRTASAHFVDWEEHHETRHALPTPEWIRAIRGCGEYIEEAYRYVVLADRRFKPKDKELYKAWRRDQGLGWESRSQQQS